MLAQLFLMVLLSPLAISDTFPDDFLFGVSTSAYQVEGAWNLSGKGESMWDWYTHIFPEKIADGRNGDIACDSYNRYGEDISLLKDMGVQFYRLSISWPRILPNGYINEINWEGVRYYQTIFKLLNDSGIEPVVTLYHWDLPQIFNEMGGWTNSLLVDLFGDYARLCFDLFGDYVRFVAGTVHILKVRKRKSLRYYITQVFTRLESKYWVTLNEPQTTCLNGYSYGSHAPGYTMDGTATYLCAYVHLMAHARAYHIYHDEFYEKQQGKVSLVLVSYWMEPNNSSSGADVIVAEKALQFGMGLFAHPIFNGNWPQIIIDSVDKRSELAGFARSRLPKLTDAEVAYINGTADYFGLNYYTTYLVYDRYNVTDRPNITSFAMDAGFGLNIDLTWPKSASSWLFDVPWGLRNLINWIADQYGNPEIFITENGFSDDASTLNDTDRIHYLNGHMCSTLRARTEDNRTVIGYTQWSIMDNFEWGVGYEERFGIVYVDFNDPNRTRTPKSSYEWFKNVVQTKTIDCTGF